MITVPVSSVSVWKTVSTEQRTKKDLLEAILARGFLVGPWARSEILESDFPELDHLAKYNLAILSHENLGLHGEVPANKVFLRLREFGYMLCPPALVLYLRLLYAEQPSGECLWCAAPLGRDSLVYGVKHDEKGRVLTVVSMHRRVYFNARAKLVCVLSEERVST